jgi:hypothetical protein
MLLHLFDVCRIGQYLKELIVRKEVESRELLPLMLQVGIEILLYPIKLHVVLLEFGQFEPALAIEEHVGFIVHNLHHLVPLSADDLEILAIACTVPLDIGGSEDVVKVEPGPLKFFPGFNGVCHHV